MKITTAMARWGLPLLRVSLGIVFFWFGVLKFFPDLSPAQGLATRTISVLTFGFVRPEVSLPVLAAWECVIGLGLLVGIRLREVLLLLFVQMAGTLTPVFLFPGEVFTRIPYAPDAGRAVHHQERRADRGGDRRRGDGEGRPRRRRPAGRGAGDGRRSGS